jgi:hypothetical protein
MAGEIISESVGGIIPERRAASPGIGTLTAHQRKEVLQRLQNGEAQADVARSYAVSQATISRLSPGPFVSAAVA